MRKPLKKLVDGRKIITVVVQQVAREFQITAKELLEPGEGENLLKLMAICLALELSGLSPYAIAGIFSETSAEKITSAPKRFQKYIKFIPGLKQKYEDIRLKIVEKMIR